MGQHKQKDVYSQHRAGMFATAHFFGLVQSTPAHREEPTDRRVCLCPMSINIWSSSRIKMCVREILSTFAKMSSALQ